MHPEDPYHRADRIFDGYRHRAMPDGRNDDYLGKPFSLRDLSEMLNRWLDPCKDKSAAGNPHAAGTELEGARRRRPAWIPKRSII